MSPRVSTRHQGPLSFWSQAGRGFWSPLPHMPSTMAHPKLTSSRACLSVSVSRSMRAWRSRIRNPRCLGWAAKTAAEGGTTYRRQAGRRSRSWAGVSCRPSLTMPITASSSSSSSFAVHQMHIRPRAPPRSGDRGNIHLETTATTSDPRKSRAIATRVDGRTNAEANGHPATGSENERGAVWREVKK